MSALLQLLRVTNVNPFTIHTTTTHTDENEVVAVVGRWSVVTAGVFFLLTSLRLSVSEEGVSIHSKSAAKTRKHSAVSYSEKLKQHRKTLRSL